MAKSFFAAVSIDTLKNLRQLVSSFSKPSWTPGSGSGSIAVLSKSRLDSQWSTWAKALPTVKPYYAVKCNPDPFLLKNLIDKGAHFDCASLREVHDVRASKVAYDMPQPEILYAHPLKSERDIRVIGENQIQTTVVDSLEECIKLTLSGWQGNALVRIAVNDKKSKMPFSVKFGATEKELDEIARHSLIPLTGISFHVGSGCESSEQYKDAIEYAAETGFAILRKYSHEPKIVDIGGGFSSDPTSFAETAKVIQDTLTRIPKNRIMIAEPGRFFAQPSQDLFVKVIAKKKGPNGLRYVIDESLYGHFSSIPFDHQKPAFIRIPHQGADLTERVVKEAILFGRTCDSLDVIAKGPMEELVVGDWLYFPLMGAYTSATASEFNGFPKPDVLYDTSDLLPTVEEAWDLTREFHRTNSTLKFSNALEPIV
jgi:ornithine decarboxylase